MNGTSNDANSQQKKRDNQRKPLEPFISYRGFAKYSPTRPSTPLNKDHHPSKRKLTDANLFDETQHYLDTPSRPATRNISVNVKRQVTKNSSVAHIFDESRMDKEKQNLEALNSSSNTSSSPKELTLTRNLHCLRSIYAKRHGTAPHQVLTDTMIYTIDQQKPQSKNELLSCYAIEAS